MDFLTSFIQSKIGVKESKGVVRYIPAIASLSCVTLFTYFYYNAFSPVLSQMAQEFGFSEVERDYYLGSRLNTIFFLVGCPCSLIISFIADSNSRREMFLGISIVCHLSSFIMQFFSSYSLLYIWRGLSGALVTSTLPIYLSILGDVFPSRLRSIASVISSIVVGCGMLAGQTISGFMSSRYGWRLFFRVTPFCDVDFPSRGEADGLSKSNSESLDNLKSESLDASQIEEKEIEASMELEGDSMQFQTSILYDIFSSRSNWMLFLQGLPGSIPWGVYTIYLHNILCTERKFSVDMASTLILAFGVGAAAGSGVAGLICGFLCSFNKSLLPIAVALCYFLALPLISSLFSLKADVESICMALHALVLTLLGLLLSIPGPCIRTILMNVNKPQCRSTVIAIGEVFNNVGRIVGPAVFTILIEYNLLSAVSYRKYNRIESIIFTSEFFYVSAAICLLLYGTYAEDEQSVVDYLNSVQASIQRSDVEKQMSSSHECILSLNSLDAYHDISPDPVSPTTISCCSPTSIRQIQKNPLRVAGEEINRVYKIAVKQAMSSIDNFSITKFDDNGNEEHMESAPLLLK